jgi:hypothetical protein
VIVLAVLIGAAVYLGNRAHHGVGSPSYSAPRPQLAAVTLCQSCAHGFNPLGDPVTERPNASLAIDNDRSTAWHTQIYVNANLGKAGTGIYIDAKPRTTAALLQVVSDTPGWKATIYARNDLPPYRWPDPAWTQISPTTTVTAQDNIQLAAATTRYRYFLVWISDLGGNDSVSVNELTLYHYR